MYVFIDHSFSGEMLYWTDWTYKRSFPTDVSGLHGTDINTEISANYLTARVGKLMGVQTVKVRRQGMATSSTAAVTTTTVAATSTRPPSMFIYGCATFCCTNRYLVLKENKNY